MDHNRLKKRREETTRNYEKNYKKLRKKITRNCEENYQKLRKKFLETVKKFNRNCEEITRNCDQHVSLFAHLPRSKLRKRNFMLLLDKYIHNINIFASCGFHYL